MKLTFEEFDKLCQGVVNYFTTASEDYSSFAKDAGVCLDAIEDCQTKEETNPENAPANRELLTATFAKHEFKVEPLAPHCDLDPIHHDFKLKFDSFSQFSEENSAAAKALAKLPRLSVIFATLENDGITCSDPKLAPSTIFKDVLFRVKRQLNALENPPKNPQQKFLVLFMRPILDAQEICEIIAKLEQWLLANVFTLAHRNNSLVPTIDTTAAETLEMLKRMESQLAKQRNDVKEVKSTVGLMHVDLTNEIQNNKNFQYDTTDRLKNIENETAFVAANLPSTEQIADAIDAAKRKAQKLVSDDDALAIMKAICHEYAATSRQTLINWRNAGHEPTTGKIITDMAFASVPSWISWCEDFHTEMERRAEIQKALQKRTKTNPPRPKNQQ